MKLNKKQKRTATIASMAALLAVVLGMGGQTFAKYIETNTVTAQTATVAKWGLTASLDCSNLFGKQYEQDGYAISASSDADAISVKANSEVIAPGTEGSMTITYGGSAEVDADLSVVANAINIVVPNVSTTPDSTPYYPIEWTINGQKVRKPSDIAAALNSITAHYEAGTAAATVNVSVISWVWEYDQGHDVEDTVLGKAAQAGNKTVTHNEVTYSAEYTFSMKFDVTLTQAD